jgi:hypothetical protein
MIDEKVIDKIRKLLALATSPNCWHWQPAPTSTRRRRRRPRPSR